MGRWLNGDGTLYTIHPSEVDFASPRSGFQRQLENSVLREMFVKGVNSRLDPNHPETLITGETRQMGWKDSSRFELVVKRSFTRTDPLEQDLASSLGGYTWRVVADVRLVERDGVKAVEFSNFRAQVVDLYNFFDLSWEEGQPEFPRTLEEKQSRSKTIRVPVPPGESFEVPKEALAFELNIPGVPGYKVVYDFFFSEVEKSGGAKQFQIRTPVFSITDPFASKPITLDPATMRVK
jgi:hypothetical protein